MFWLIGLAACSTAGIIALGVYYEIRPLRPGAPVKRWLKGVTGTNLIIFLATELGLMLIGMPAAFGQVVGGTVHNVSVGTGLALIGIGLPTGLAAIGAGIAVGPVGASSLAIIAEKPEMFGRTLIYLGLAEGIAIYGIVITILLLGKVS